MTTLQSRESLPDRPPASTVERRLSFFILSLLAVIGVAMVVLQAVYDPALWRERSDNQPFPGEVPGRQTASPAVGAAVAGLEPMAPVEQYDTVTLSDKINGKAELYLGAGFRSLETRRFALSGTPGVWLERFVYEMGGQRNAFAVFSSQRRQPFAALDFVDHGYLSSNGLYFIHGPYYVEIIASQASDAVQAKLKALAQNFIQTHDAPGVKIAELALFPVEDRVAGSMVLIADSAFGLAGLDWVFTAAFQRDGSQATAFITPCRSETEARSLATAFNGYWTEFGGETVASSPALPGAHMVTILDAFEIAVVQGRYLLGVHEATHLDFGISLAARLKAMVAEAVP